MGVTIHVNGKSNSLVHKGSMGIAKSTIPDVCKTPSPGGPVPVPYPVIVSMSSDLKKGTKTVKVDGKNPAAVKGSEFSRCSGDEPGTAGGVKSSTNMKEATWLLYSFDVKLDGKNACRLSDKMMMNHGNAACLSGETQLGVVAMDPDEKAFKCAVKECDYKYLNKSEKSELKNAKAPCKKLGEIKHQCVKEKMKNRPNVQNEPSYDTAKNPVERLMRSSPNQNQPCQNFYSAIASVRRNCKAEGVSYKKGRMRRPDCVCGDQPPRKVFDAKFPCPRSVKRGAFSGRNSFPSANTTGESMWSPGQKDAYRRIAGKGGKVEAVAPNDVRNLQCP